MSEAIHIYNSDNEEGLLKSIGPYRVTTADMSIAGVRLPHVIRVSVPVTVGKTKIYGIKIVGRRILKSPEAPSSK